MDANIHKAFACRYPSNNLCKVIEEWHHDYFLPLLLLFIDTLRPRDRGLGRCGGFVFWFLRTIVTLMPETALVSFRTLAFFFPRVTNAFSSFNATHSLSTPYHGSRFSSQNFAIEVSDLYSSSPLSSDNRASISSDESPCRTIPKRF